MRERGLGEIYCGSLKGRPWRSNGGSAWESFRDWSESSGLVRFFGEEELAAKVESMIEGNEL